jgi:hypothetical protein
MRRYWHIAAALVLIGASVPADADPDGDVVRIGRLDCQRLVRHLPRPDVAYRPGVDVRGEHVVPAEVDQRPRLRLPETIYLSISVDLCERLDPATGRKLCRRMAPGAAGPVEQERFEAEAALGTVTVTDDGRRVSFNGQALTDEAAAVVAEACRRRIDRHWRARRR